MQMKLLGITCEDFDVIGLIRSDQMFYIRQILEKKWEYNGTVHQVFIDFKKTHYIVVRKLEQKRSLYRPRRGWQDNMKNRFKNAMRSGYSAAAGS
jgi:hypothetical protein